jgi:hypothetical protein
MSKRTKKSRSSLKVEALEQRQLLATIIAGSGENVADAQDVKLANGNTYDQVLMTGSSVTVGADAGQITRIDFLDADGDITRVEFSGSGQLTVSLADFQDAKVADKYETTQKYVSGNATFRITGSDASSNVTIYSLGQGTVTGGLTNKIFGDGTKLGGDHTANVTRLVIEGDNSALGSQFGGIYAGNALFSGSTGAVGIVAPDVQFQGPITIGDIDLTGDNALAVIQLGQFSATKTVNVAGGDLKLANGAWVGGTSNVSALVMKSGTNSNAELLSTQAVDGGALTGLSVDTSAVSYQSSEAKVVVDGKTVTDAELEAYSKMYLNEVELSNWTDGKVFKAHLIGKVTVTGDLGGLITTDLSDDNQSDSDEFGIGDVTVTGKIVSKGAIESATTIGNVEIQGGMDFSTNAYTLAGATGIITTLGRDGQSASIGNIKFGGDVKLAGTVATLILAGADTTAPSTSGDIGTIEGKVLNKTGGAATVIDNNLGKIGNVTFTDAVSIVGATSIEAAGAIGDIKGKTLVLTDVVSKNSIGNISTSGEGVLTLGAVTADKSIGSITSTKGNITLGGLVWAKEGTQGAITSNTGSITITGGITTVGAINDITANGGDLKIDGKVEGKSIGAITVNGDAKHLRINANVVANTTSVGDISVNGLKGANIVLTGGMVSAVTSIGDVKVAGGRLIGTAGAVDFEANQIGDISVTAHKDMTLADATVAGDAVNALIQDVVFSATSTVDGTDSGKASAKSASIGNIVLDASAKTGIAVVKSVASTGAGLGAGFSSSGSIGDVTITASESGKLLAASTASLVVRAGNANMGADNSADTYADGVNTDGTVSIGAVSIAADLSGLSGGLAGQGLIIASGVQTATGGVFAIGGATNIATTDITKQGTGTIGAVKIENFDSVTGTDIRGFSSSTVTSGGAFAAGSVIIADKIASIDVATAVDVKHYTPTGQPLKGAVAVGAATGADDLYVVVL